MTKIYLAHSLATTAEFNDSKRVAIELRAIGYEVSVASENTAINDKRNNPEPFDIYNGDVSEIISSNIFVVNLSGGLQDGTVSEIGVVAGYNEALDAIFDEYKEMPIIAYTSNARLLHPQFHKGIPSASANHLVLGMIERWGEFVGGEAEMIAKLRSLK